MRWDIFHPYLKIWYMHNAFLARLWATLLPFLLMWEYNNLTKLFASTFTSSNSKPVGDKLRSSDFKAWIKPRESPSRIALWNPNSNAKVLSWRLPAPQSLQPCILEGFFESKKPKHPHYYVSPHQYRTY